MVHAEKQETHKSLHRKALLRTLCLVVLVLITFSAAYIQTFQYSNIQPSITKNKLVVSQIRIKGQKPVRIILYYTKFFGDNFFTCPHAIPHNFGEDCGCDFTNCQLTCDTSMFSKSHAVIFHGRDMPSVSHLESLLSKKPNEQKWVYYVVENPHNAPPVAPLDKYFDWTLTYRANSDFRAAYTQHIKLKNETELHKINYAKNKNKQVAWLVSHCGTPRDEFAKALERHGIEVDVGGGCANKFKHQLHCKERSCDEELKQYRFYLSAENDFCEDYVTEKYYIMGIKGNTIPIVLGGANYSNPSIAVPGSFINPLDFENMKKFVEHLKLLMNDDAKYNEYFQWKKNWSIPPYDWGCGSYLCDMCKKLNSYDVEEPRTLSSQISGDCEKPLKRYKDWMKAS